MEGALAIRGGDVSSMLSLAAVRKGTGDAKGAVEVLERAAALVPEVRERYLEPLLRQIDEGREGGGKRGGGKAKARAWAEVLGVSMEVPLVVLRPRAQCCVSCGHRGLATAGR